MRNQLREIWRVRPLSSDDFLRFKSEATEGRRVVKEADSAMPWWYKWVQGLIVVGLVAFATTINVLVIEMNLGRVSTGFLALVTNGLMMYAVIYWRRKSLALSYRRVLRQKGICVCLWCGYDLQGLDRESGCPECGWLR